MAKKAKASGKKKSKAVDPKLSAQEQQDLSEAVEKTRAVPYKMQSQYQPRMVIEHPKFGLGVVIKSFEDKIEVNFSDGAKALVHNRR